MKCIIVDDEHLALLRIEALIKDVKPNMFILAKCSSGEEAIKFINSHKPDLVFLDIQMPEIDGFQVLDSLKYKPLIIFTTAYDEFAMKAFRAKGIRYLLKPIKSAELLEAIEFSENHIKSSEKGSLEKHATLIVKELGKKIFIPIKEIELINTKNRIVFIYYDGCKKIIADKGMDDYEILLPKESFFRTHRSHIINMNCIESVKNGIGGKRMIMMKNGIEAILSRDHVKEFERMFK